MDNELFIKNIEWDMLDKWKFFPLSTLSTFCVRCTLYPLTLIKTRLQIQKRSTLYTGMLDAYGKIYKSEGLSGFYKGFWVSSFQIFSGLFYITTYENVRYMLSTRNVDSNLKTLIAGSSASIVGQTIVVPFDVISQHLMLSGIYQTSRKAIPNSEFNTLKIDNKMNSSNKFKLTFEICQKILKYDGIAGFYRGYTASLCAYVPNSALWWTFYHLYQDYLYSLKLSNEMSQLFVQSVSGTLGGFTATLMTNPLDIMRTRLQVQRAKSSMNSVIRNLWLEEGIHMFTKGLTARLIQSACFSFSIILGYETIKRISIHDQYKGFIRW